MKKRQKMKIMSSAPARRGARGLLRTGGTTLKTRTGRKALRRTGGTTLTALKSPTGRRALRRTAGPLARRRARRSLSGGKLLGIAAGVVAGIALALKGRNRDGGTVEHAKNRAMGAVREVMGAGTTTPVDDQELVQHVRSNVLGRERWQGFTVNVDAADGVVTLRGQLDTEESINELERQVAELSGVQRVENLLHLPGEPAPNVVAAEEASEQARRDASATRSGIE